MSKIEPLYDRVMIERIPVESVTESGLIIPDQAKEKPVRGRVISVGAGKVVDGKHIPLFLKEGDLVLLGRYAGVVVELEKKEYAVLKEEDVLAKISE